VLALSLGFIPVFVLLAMIGTIAVKSEGALTDLSGPTRVPAGAQPTPTPQANVTPISTPVDNETVIGNAKKLFGTDFSTQYSGGVGQYGLRPAIWGTIEIMFIAMALAIPVALAMGIFAAEFPLGFLGRWLRIILGILGGIPPIVYALMAVIFVGPFISNKFTADLQFSDPDPGKVVGVENWPPDGVPWNAGAFPWDPTGQDNSLLLGGIMLSLLVIPFIAPLFEDALRNVPSEPKEASLGLGATRWYTLRRVTLPRAMPSIIAASGLGALKVLGDVMIVLFVVGVEAELPNPLFDVLERTGPLTSTGAALVGGVNTPNACTNARDCSVGYFTALLLLFMALVIVSATTLLERRFRRRLGV
jgi:ABC-type phosphate transport system permease subunit